MRLMIDLKEVLLSRKNGLFLMVSMCVACWFLSAGSVLAKTCKINLSSPAVTLEIYEGEVKVSNGHSSSQLASKFGGHNKFSRSAGWVTRGLTKTNLESRIEVHVQYQQQEKNRFCVGLKGVSARVGYSQFNVYVARDLQPGSCEYKVTMDHEQTHVAVYRDQLKQFATRFENRLNRAARTLKPVLSGSAKSGQNYFLRKLNSEFKQVFRQLSRETDTRQGRLDTPENYRREQAFCPAPPG